ncbi:MAG: HIT family protein [Candidatus Nanoarchaeia archaeon]|nr:HIT family protein [Candidatus Nanoarchaeia archaeon]
MENCIFCKIINGEIPAYKIYEDEDLLAFLDKYPINPGHTLVVPKNHAETVIECPDNILEKIMPAVKKIMFALRKAVNPDGFNLLSNNGEVSGQEIMHYHMHIIPRFSGDEKEYAIKELFKSAKELPENEMKTIYSNILKYI